MTEHSTVGALLRARRLELGISLDEVADRTRVRRTYLTALESDRLDLIPGEVYAAGFLRLYAEELGLPAAPLLARCRGQLTAGDAEEEKARVSQARRNGTRRRGSGLGAAISAALLVGAAILLAQFNAGETKKADFFAPRSPPDPFPTVLWWMLLPETGARRPPMFPLLPRENLAPEQGGAPTPEALAVVSPSARFPQSDRRPVDVLLGWGAERPGPSRAVGAGPELLVMNRKAAPEEGKGGHGH